MKCMVGQMSIFDIGRPDGSRKPCDYSFQRYIGQKVVGWHGYNNRASTPALTITKIEPYYTIAVDKKGREYALTPTTIKAI